MPVHAPKYSHQQRDAVETFAIAHPELNAPQIAARAARGELTHDGQPVAPFDIPATYVRALRTRGKRRREREQRSTLATLPPRDAVEELRRRLVALADQRTKQLERQSRAGRLPKDYPEQIRQLARVVREIAAIPGPEGKRPQAPRPGHGAPGEREGAETRGGLAGSVAAAMRPRGIDPAETAQDVPLPITPPEETTTPAPTSSERINAADVRDPGSFARASIEAMRTRPAAP